MHEGMLYSGASAVGLSVVHFLWQGTVIGVAAAVVLGLMRGAGAQARYVVACAALAACAVAFGATLRLMLLGASGGNASGTSAVAPVMIGGVEGAHGARSGGDVLPVVAALWLTGVAAFGLRFGLQIASANRLRRRGVSAPGRELGELFDGLKREMGVGRGVRVLRSTLAEVPMVVGWLSPVVLVPVSALTSLSRDQLRAVLVHELFHLRRQDHLVNAAQVVIETSLFFHPVVWWLSGQVRSERENCCDDAAVAAAGDARVFAEALARLEAIRLTHRQAALAANGGLLMDRINRILRTRQAGASGRVVAPWRTLTALAAGAALMVGGVSYAGAPDSQDDRLAKLRLAVTTGMPKEEARKIYDSLIYPGSNAEKRIEAELSKVSAEIEAAVASGRLTEDEGAAKLAGARSHLAQKVDMVFSMDVLGMTRGEAHLSVTHAHLMGLVAAGEMTEDEAHAKLAALEREVTLQEAFKQRIGEMHERLRAAVEAGEMEPAEARAKLQEMKRQMEVRARLHETMQQIVELEASGELSKEEAAHRIEVMKHQLHAVMEKAANAPIEPDWAQIKKRIEGAVERGDMTREEAEAHYSRLKEEQNVSRDEGAVDANRVSFEGRITAVGRGGIAVETRRGDLRVTVTERTRISRNGERARLSSLQEGDAVHVSGVIQRTRQGREIVAHGIRARGR